MKSFDVPSGAKIPAIGLGTWKMSPDQASVAVSKAIELGYRHIDCAWIYQNESGVGQGIQTAFQSSPVKREELWITSKLWNDCHRREHVAGALKQTLSDLKLDYLDLYLIHWPVVTKHGVPRAETGSDYVSLADVPLVETWQAMKECLDLGLCRNIGVSNFNRQHIESLISDTGICPAVNQVELHPLLAQNELLDFCSSQGIVMTAYSPLGSGDRPDEMKKSDEPSLFDLDEVKQIANHHEATNAQILLAWQVNRGVVAIPKSATPAHMQQNLDAANIQLSESEMETLNGLDSHFRFVDGKFWEMDGGPYTAADLWGETS